MAARNTGRWNNPEGSWGLDVEEDIDIWKAWKLQDPYKFAPQRPDGDPWKVLLDPLLEKERIECDAWKDEVGNLLIFAGLFSAVLTGFVVDSYKNLQPSDSKDIVALLSQIMSIQVNSTLSTDGTTTIIPSSQVSFQLPSQTFKPPSSAIRINTLWFVSLILSLAVVLIGIVTLQWLRQYQSFPGQNPREALALYTMRSEGMRRWHVWKILMALPVVLQVSLVLFLVGILDFMRTLTTGEGAVATGVIMGCVGAAVGVTLLFLVATTTLPALQVLFLPIRLMILRARAFGSGADSAEHQKKQRPPSQCPYKSPQSSLVCGLVEFLMKGCAVVLGWSRSEGESEVDGEKGNMKKNGKKGTMRIHLSALWSTRSWIEFDLIWLRIRDACAQRVYKGRFGRLEEEAEEEGMSIDVPFYDTFSLFRSFTKKGLGQMQALSSEAVVAAYHCLADISGALTVGRLAPAGPGVPGVGPGRDMRGELEMVKEWNRYLRYSCDEQFETLEFTLDSTPHIGPLLSPGAAPIALASDTIRLLHDQNLCMFLDHISDTSSGNSSRTSSTSTSTTEAKEVFFHRQELKVRIQQYMLAGKSRLVPSSRFAGVYPTYLEFAHERSVWRGFEEEELVFTYQYTHIIYNIFAYLSYTFATYGHPYASNTQPQPITNMENTSTGISPTDLHARSEVLILLEECMRAISRVTAYRMTRQARGNVRLGTCVKELLESVRLSLADVNDSFRDIPSASMGVGASRPGSSGGRSAKARPEDLLHVLYCVGMVVCGCVGLPDGRGSRSMPFESAYMDLQGMLKDFKKGTRGGMSMTMGRKEVEEYDAAVRDTERKFREAYPNDGGEVEKGMWDTLHFEELPPSQAGGSSTIPFVVLLPPAVGNVQMPMPARFM